MEKNNNDDNCYLTPVDIVHRSLDDNFAMEHNAYLTPLSVSYGSSGGSALMGVDFYLTPILTVGESSVSEDYLTPTHQSKTEAADEDSIRPASFNSNNVINIVDKQLRRMPTNANHEPPGETDFFDNCDNDDEMCPFDVEHSSKDAYEDHHQYTALKPDQNADNLREWLACEEDHTDDSNIYHTINEELIRQYMEIEDEACSLYSVERCGHCEQNNTSELQYMTFEVEEIQQTGSASEHLQNTESVVALQASWRWRNRSAIFFCTLIAVIFLCIAVVVTMTQVQHQGTTMDIVETTIPSESPSVTDNKLTSSGTYASESWTSSMVPNNPDKSVIVTETTPARGNESRNFFLSFMNTLYDNFYIGVRIATAEGANVTISAPGVSFEKSITTHSRIYSFVQMHSTLIPEKGSIERKGIQIRAITEESSVIGVLQEVFTPHLSLTTDAFLVLPEEMISTSYFIASYYTVIESSEFVIVSTASNTDISITFQLSERFAFLTSHGRIYHSGSQLNISLNKLDTFYIEAPNDLTGTAIRSNKKIAVFAGTACVTISVVEEVCRTLAEQMLPVDAWSKRYVVSPVYPNTGYVVRILAAVDATEVKVYNDSRTLSKVLNSGNFTELILGTGPLVVTSDEPVSVVQYGFRMSYGPLYGGPFMTVVPGINRFMTSYRFFCFPMFQCYVSIIIKFEHKEGLLLDNENVSATLEKSVPTPLNIYTTLVIAANAGSHTIKHSSNNVDFGVLVYGIQKYDSFGYAAGYAVNKNVPGSD